MPQTMEMMEAKVGLGVGAGAPVGKRHGSRVLVVDDDPDILTLLGTALRDQFEVLTAPDGEAGVALLQRVAVDCIVADHMMPGLNGVQMLTRARDLQPHAVRILVTATERVEDLRDAVNHAQVHRFLTKPVRLMELRTLVAEALRLHQLEQENQRLVVELQDKNEQLTDALVLVQQHEHTLEREVEQRTKELRVANAELEKLALRDGLTGLYNHRFFQEAMAQELSRAARYGNPVGLIFLDVDHFKNFNDMLGHPAGDALLKVLARILTNTGEFPDLKFSGRVSDIVARYGGEEFVLILPQTSTEGTITCAERLRETVADYPFEGREVQPGGKVTVSVGVACFPDDALTKQEIISAADQMVFLSKRNGRNRVSVHGKDRPAA